jgi:membrane-bound lytic murein transglycosylase A
MATMVLLGVSPKALPFKVPAADDQIIGSQVSQSPHLTHPNPLEHPAIPPFLAEIQAEAINPEVLPLRPVALEHLSPTLGLDPQIWGWEGFDRDWQTLLKAVDHSLAYLGTPAAIEAYADYPIAEISHRRVTQSLQRFRQLLFTARSPQDLQRQVQAEFVFYQATGKDHQGTVDFTGYFEPTYQASPYPTSQYTYPLYRRPADLDTWSQPHPTRTALEGATGIAPATSPLKGLELVWLADRLEAYLIQVQGSARLQLTDGTVMGVGYAGRTEYPYRSLGRALVEAGHFSLEALTLPKVIGYFQDHPQDLDQFIPLNDRFIFFQSTQSSAPIGSLQVPVLAERSIATDKSLMPPGALALLQAELPYLDTQGNFQQRSVSRYVLDQDTGGAIQGAGRADIFMGTGQIPGERAGLINTQGQMFYLLLKE